VSAEPVTLAEFSRRGGAAGTGDAKVRKTSFNSRTAKAAAKARKEKREKLAVDTVSAHTSRPNHA